MRDIISISRGTSFTIFYSMCAWYEPVQDFLSFSDHYPRSKPMPAHRAGNELLNRLFARRMRLRYNLPLLTETHGYCQY